MRKPIKMRRASIRVVLLFTTAIFVSFIPEQIPQFLGDWVCKGCNYGEPDTSTFHQSTLHWGYRHWLFFAMGFVLFVMQAVDIINEPEKK